MYLEIKGQCTYLLQVYHSIQVLRKYKQETNLAYTLCAFFGHLLNSLRLNNIKFIYEGRFIVVRVNFYQIDIIWKLFQFGSF